MLAGNLFHFKKDQAEYSIKQEDHGSKPLFSKKGASQTLLNEFFFYVLSRVSSWQCMTELRVTTLDDVEDLLLRSQAFYGALQESKSGMEMPKVPVVSRYFVTYLASFVAIAPFFRAKDERVQTGTVKFFDKALSKLASMKDTALSASCIARPLFGPSGFLSSIARIAPMTPRSPRFSLDEADGEGLQ